MRRHAWLLGVVAMLASAPAAALDIDQIRVYSPAGQPLFAQIPLQVDDPAELRSLEVALASPATFARIGLPRPQGAVADLRFRVERDARAPMIVVETSQAVTEPFLTFLIQLQWDGGQMVREFSVSMGNVSPPQPVQEQVPAAAVPAVPPASVGAPAVAPDVPPEPAAPQITLPADTAALPEQPVAIPLRGDPAAVEAAPAPAAAAAPTPVAATAPPPAEAVQAAPQPPLQPGPQTAPIPVIDRRTGARAPVASAPTSAAQVPAAAPPVAAVPTPAPAPASPSRMLAPVTAGDNLTRIARELAGPEQSLEQVMVALVRANPQAFANGNINQLQRGAQLRVPDAAQIAQMSRAQAEAAVREQTRLWLDGQAADTPALQPLAMPTPAVPARAAAAAAAPIPVQPQSARLQILPPEAGQATTPGAGGGDAARNEEVATALLRSEEDIRQLKERLANLEEVSRKQQQLIAMQERQLRLQGVGGSGSGLGWLIGLIGVLLGALVWWRTRPQAFQPRESDPTWHAARRNPARGTVDASP